MKRLRDWDQRLFAAIDSARDVPFEWGRHDCAMFAACLVEAMTGEDIGSAIAGTYSSAATAKRKYRDVARSIDRLLGEDRRIDPFLAQRGDVVLLDGGVIAICVGNEAVTVGEKGVQFAPMQIASAAWRIG